MPFETPEYDLLETLDEKEERLAEIAREAHEIEQRHENYRENPAYQRLIDEGSSIETHITGLEWALDQWDEPTVTLKSMTGGEVAKMENDLADANGPGDTRIVTIVHGTEDAPFVTDDEAEMYASVGQLHYAFQVWLESEINSLTSGNDSRSRFARLLEEERQQAGGAESSDTSGS